MTSGGDVELPNDRRVSPAWLSRALARDFPGAQVIDAQPESLHEGTASTARLYVNYAPASAAGPRTVCIKWGVTHGA